MNAAPDLLEAALAYAGRGLQVFPCVPQGKEPAVRRGFYAATTNPETIRRLWRRSDLNVAIRTGAASGFWVLDVDVDADKDGEANLRALEAKHGPLPPTVEAISGDHGRHCWFRYTGSIQSTDGRIAPGIDTRGDGGYVIAPPSIHPSGRAYAWSVDSVDTLAPAPDWLLQLARRKPAPSISERAVATIRQPSNGSRNPYGEAALANEIAILASTPPGQRNNRLNVATFSLFQLVAGGELERNRVVDLLIDACHRNGLVQDDGLRSVVMTIRSGARAGTQYPRSHRVQHDRARAASLSDDRY